MNKAEIKAAVKEALSEFLQENSFTGGLRSGVAAPSKSEVSLPDELGRVEYPYGEYLRAKYNASPGFPAKKFYLPGSLKVPGLSDEAKRLIELNVAAAGFKDNKAFSLSSHQEWGLFGSTTRYELDEVMPDVASYQATPEELGDILEKRLKEKQAQEYASDTDFTPRS